MPPLRLLLLLLLLTTPACSLTGDETGDAGGAGARHQSVPGRWRRAGGIPHRCWLLSALHEWKVECANPADRKTGQHQRRGVDSLNSQVWSSRNALHERLKGVHQCVCPEAQHWQHGFQCGTDQCFEAGNAALPNITAHSWERSKGSTRHVARLCAWHQLRSSPVARCWPCMVHGC